MRILFIGDVFGKAGRKVLKAKLQEIKEKFNPNFIIANVENAAGGRGVNEKVANELFAMDIDAGTGGNHIWEQESKNPVLNKFAIARPLNVDEKSPGKGFLILEKNSKKLAVISLQGSVYMNGKGVPTTNPFHVIQKFIEEKNLPKSILIDFHAEATSEKRALLWFLNGKVSAILGTHTHVQTADEEITEEGTAYITDVGMTGPHKSVIGMKPDRAIERFLGNGKKSLVVAKEGVRIEAVMIDVDESTGKAISILRLMSSFNAAVEDPKEVHSDSRFILLGKK